MHQDATWAQREWPKRGCSHTSNLVEGAPQLYPTLLLAHCLGENVRLQAAAQRPSMGTMSEYQVDVIVPVHSATRPILRTVQSVLDHTDARCRVTVVAHNIDPQIIRSHLGEFAAHPDLRLLELSDGIPSPSGPMNLGLEVSTAPYFSLLGSDDELSPGAIDSWLAIARATDATTVLARIDREGAGADPLPPTRRGRTRDLDAAKDRLCYRCAPLGLVSRERFGELRFTPELGSGEDLEFTAELWFRGAHIAYDRTGPSYYVHADQADRVTSAQRSVAEDFAFFDAIVDAAWFSTLTRQQRKALSVKTLRLHFFDAILARLESPGGISEHRSELLGALSRIESVAPGSVALLSRADRKVIDELSSPAPDSQRIRQLLSARWGAGTLAVLPRNPLLAFHRQGPYRTLRNTRP